MFEILELKEKNAILKAKGIEIKARIKYQAQDLKKNGKVFLKKLTLYIHQSETQYILKKLTPASECLTLTE